MRIGTWNLEGRGTRAHTELLQSLDCDVLLLTEVKGDLELTDYYIHRTSAPMSAGKTWAAVASREMLAPLPDPHFATALASCADWNVASSVLPWSGGGTEMFGEGTTADKTIRTLDALVAALPRERLIWGGDWNHAIAGGEYAGSIAGRKALSAVLNTFETTVPTAGLSRQIKGLMSIDHIAVPHWADASATRIDAAGLSDHDAYVVELSS